MFISKSISICWAEYKFLPQEAEREQTVIVKTCLNSSLNCVALVQSSPSPEIIIIPETYSLESDSMPKYVCHDSLLQISRKLSVSESTQRKTDINKS